MWNILCQIVLSKGMDWSVPVAEMAMEKSVQLLMTVDNGVSSLRAWRI